MATSESITSYARYAIRDGDGVRKRATIESVVSYARYAVGSVVVGNGFWNFNSIDTIITQGIFISYFYSIRYGTAGNVVVEIV